MEQKIEVTVKITWRNYEGDVPGDLRSPNMNVTSCEWYKLLSLRGEAEEIRAQLWGRSRGAASALKRAELLPWDSMIPIL